MAAGAINSWTFGKGFVFFILSDGDRDENKKKALEGSAQSTPSNGNQLRRRGRNEIGALAPHHRDFQKKIHFFPFKNEKLNEMGITGRNPIKKRNRIHFFFSNKCNKIRLFLFLAGAICNGATCKWRRPWPQDQPKKNKKQNEINGHMKRISIGLWKKKAFDPDTRFVIGANNRFILSSRLTLEYQTVMQLPFIKKKKHFDRIKIKPISTDRNSGQ